MPGKSYVSLAGQRPDATWMLVNKYGFGHEKVVEFQVVLQQTTYKQEAETQALKALTSPSEPRLALLRWAGALIEHLYLDELQPSVAQAERAARLCHLMISFWEARAKQDQRGEEQALVARPALWRSYRKALAVMDGAHDALLRERETVAEEKRDDYYRSLLRRPQNIWLDGWKSTLTSEYERAQREVAEYGAKRARVVQLRILVRLASGEYPVEIEVERGGFQNPVPLHLDSKQLVDPEQDPDQVYGEQLGKLLFGDSALGLAYRAAIERICKDGDHPQVLLRLDPPELQSLRWERIYHPWNGTWQPLGMTEATPFARLVPSGKLVTDSDGGRLPIKRTLKALVIIASPPYLGSYGLGAITEDERLQYHRLFDGLDGIAADFLESGAEPIPTLTELGSILTKQYDIVHIVCHGSLGSDKAEAPYRLFLDHEPGDKRNQTGNNYGVPGEELVKELSGRVDTPQLCFLAACESASRIQESPFLPLGQALVQSGAVRRVIAMDGKVGRETARRFAAVFYRQVATHRFIDLAVNEARQAVRDTHDWGMPILFRD